MTATSEHRVCRCCEKYKAYIDGLCWGCHAEYRRHESDFADTAEDRGYGKVQQARDESRWK